jgi:hypothetical protein
MTPADTTTATEFSVTWPQALAWRLERALLDPVGTQSVARVVQRLGAVPSMDEALAELAVRTRRQHSRSGELAQALADGTVIKAFAFRGAVHHLSAQDGGVYLALRSAGRQWELPSWVDYYGLTSDAWPDFRAAVRDSLTGGPLTVVELGAALTGRTAYRHLAPIFDSDPWTLLKPLTSQGDLSFGAPRDGKATFQRLDTNRHWRGIPDLEDAGPRAITAYVGTYGPTTRDHLHHWLGQGLSAGRKRLDRWITELGDDLVPVDVAGTAAFVRRGDADSLAATVPSSSVRFLPGHDQWVMGVGTKDANVTPPALRELVTRKANPVIHGGVVTGTWALKGDTLTITWQGDGPRPDTAIEAEATRLSHIIGRDLAVHVATC